MFYKKGDFCVVPTKMLVGLDAKAQLIFMWMCHHANSEGNCFPSIGKLSKESALSQDSVIRAVKILVEKKYLVKQKRHSGKRKMSNLYQILLVDKPVDNIGMVVAHSDYGSRTQRVPVVAHSDPNYTHENYTHRTIGRISKKTGDNNELRALQRRKDEMIKKHTF